MMQGTIFDIKRFAIHDGPGIRTTVFLKGCRLNCWWCHNPESRRSEPELISAESPGETPVTVGRRVSTDEVMAEIEKDVLFYDESGGGVTVSGGEPLLQPDFLAELLAECGRRGIHTTLDTAGHAPSEILARIAPMVDLFLFDLKIMADDRHRCYVGVPNRGILRNLRWLAEGGRRIVVRFPLIPRINDSLDNLEAMQALLRDLGLRRIDVLPFHRIHRRKYHRLGIPDRMEAVPPPDREAVGRVCAFLASGGFSIRAGG